MNRPVDCPQGRYALAATLAFGVRQSRRQHGPVLPRWSHDSRWMWFGQRHDSGILFDAPALTQALAQATGQSPTLPQRRVWRVFAEELIERDRA